MDYSLFANPPPVQFFTGVGVGLLICALLIVLFLRRGKCTGPTRSIALVLISLISGPLLGSAICGIAILCGAFYAVDRWYNLEAFVKVGMIAGILGAILIVLLACPLRHCDSKSAEKDEEIN